ncbi:MAG: hypothetical protein ACM3ME_06250 [Chloroflexota bacterium]|nr:hypothetical protein [Lentimicrobium sp.]
MAEIKIEKKKPAWPWVLIGLIVLGVIGYLVFANNDGRHNNKNDSAYDNGSDINKPVVGTDNTRTKTDNTKMTRDKTRVSMDNNRQSINSDQAVAEYVNFVKTDLKGSDIKNMNHEKLRQAFMHLTEACEAKAAQVGYKSSNLNIAREHADQLVADRSDTTSTENIRATADILSDELINIQKKNFPKLDREAAKVKDASASIKPQESVKDQRQEIKSFLSEAADLLEDMDDTGNGK